MPISPETAPSRTAIGFAGETLWLDARGAVYWPAQDLLAVADLHFEKASFLARAGHPLPPYDTRDSLATLASVVATYQPRHLVLLGDSFHDPSAVARMDAGDLAALAAIARSVETCFWIEGNHEGPGFRPPAGVRVTEFRAAGLAFRHQPDPDDTAAQLVGHYHPKATLRRGGHRIRGRCFLVSADLLILPAFGSFTGGLDSTDAALTAVFAGAEPRTFLCYRGSIYPVAITVPGSPHSRASIRG